MISSDTFLKNKRLLFCAQNYFPSNSFGVVAGRFCRNQTKHYFHSRRRPRLYGRGVLRQQILRDAEH